MKSISTLVISILVFGFVFMGLSHESEAGVLPLPPNPICCANNNICADNSLGGPFLCPLGSELVEGQLCDANNECAPVPPPSATRNVPALSSWGFMALGVGLAILALGALLLKRQKENHS